MGKDLLKAAEAGNYEKLIKLLKLKKKLDDLEEGEKIKPKGVDVDFRNPDRKTSFMLAAQKHHVECMEALITCSCDINARDYLGNTALHLAVESNCTDKVLTLLVDGNSEGLDLRNKDQDTPLHIAAKVGNRAACVKLLQNGANCRIFNTDKKTCLDIAAEYGSDVICGILAEEPGMARSYGALFVALEKKFVNVARALLEAGMSSSCRDEDHNTPLHVAVKNEDIAMVKELLRHGASPNLSNGKEISPMKLAVQMNSNKTAQIIELFKNMDQIEKFQKRGAEVHVRSDTRHYPLMKSKIWWVGETPQFCSASTGSCWALVDNDKNTTCELLYNKDRKNYWAMDFRRPYNISGIRVLGNGSACMIKVARLEQADSMAGPWKIIQELNFEKQGAEEYKNHAGVAQDHIGFHKKTQCVRLSIDQNFGGFFTAVNQISFFGVDTRLLSTLEEFECMDHLDSLLEHGFAHAVDLWILRFREDETAEICNNDTAEIIKFRDMIRHTTEKENKLTYLSVGESGTFPVSHIQNKRLPELVIEADPGTDDQIELFFEGTTAVEGELKTFLVPDKIHGGPSKARFKNIKVMEDGEFYYGVRSVDNPELLCDNTMYDVNFELQFLGKEEMMEQVSTSMALFDIM